MLSVGPHSDAESPAWNRALCEAADPGSTHSPKSTSTLVAERSMLATRMFCALLFIRLSMTDNRPRSAGHHQVTTRSPTHSPIAPSPKAHFAPFFLCHSYPGADPFRGPLSPMFIVRGITLAAYLNSPLLPAFGLSHHQAEPSEAILQIIHYA